MPLPATACLMEFTPASVPERGGTALAILETAPSRATQHADALEAAFQQGKAEGLAAARAEAATLAEEAEAAAAQRLAEARAAWATEEADRLASLMAQGLKALETEIGEVVAATLSPFLDEAVRRRSVEELARSLSLLLKDGEMPAIRIGGPADLLNALKLKLGEAAAGMAFEVTEDIDVRIVAGRSTIDTQIAAWRQRIAQVHRDEQAGVAGRGEQAG